LAPSAWRFAAASAIAAWTLSTGTRILICREQHVAQRLGQYRLKVRAPQHVVVSTQLKTVKLVHGAGN